MEDNFELNIKCILCGTQICGVKEPFRLEESAEMDSFNSDSIDSLWQLLFKFDNSKNFDNIPDNYDLPNLPNSDRVLKSKYLLHKAGYCSNCRQQIWDLDFQFKTLKRIRKQVSKVCQLIIKGVYDNCHQNLVDVDKTDNESNCLSIRRKITRDSSCSYEEALLVIFEALKVEGRFSNFDNSLKPDTADNIDLTIVKVDPESVCQEDIGQTSCDLADADVDETGRYCRQTRFQRKRKAVTRKNKKLEKETADLVSFDSKIKMERVEDDEDDDDNFSKDFDFLPQNDPEENDLSSSSNGDDTDVDFDPPTDDEDEDLAQFSLKSARSNLKPKSLPRIVRKRRPRGQGSQAVRVRKKHVPCTEPNCNQFFKDEICKEGHIRKVHLGLPNPFHCSVCTKDFRDAANLRSHNQSKHEGTFAFSCPTCNKGFNYKMNLKVHFQAVHNNKRMELLKEFQHPCPICTKGFKNEEDLALHSKVHEGPTPFSCEDCSESFENSVDLINHVRTIHQNLRTQRFLCSTCGKSFCSRWYLRTHERLVHPTLAPGDDPGGPFKCTQCPETFKASKLLKRHLREKHDEDEKKFQCEVCGRWFKEASGLRYHLLTHSADKPIKCKICGKGFYQTAHCKKHEQTHSGVRKSICSVCGKACTNKDNLKLHMRVHDKEGGGGGRGKRSEVNLSQSQAPPASAFPGAYQSEGVSGMGVVTDPQYQNQSNPFADQPLPLIYNNNLSSQQQSYNLSISGINI